VSDDYGCPRHPQSNQWWREFVSNDGSCIRWIPSCGICGVPLAQSVRDEFALNLPEPVTVRSFALYRELASKTDGEHRREYYAMKLAAEVGELLNLLGKRWEHGHDIPDSKLREEAGDCLWYLDQLCKHLWFTLEQVASENVAKLQKRYGDSFSEERSRNREVE
jgi:NTP pyrophosphatase (non-canonical NTP hydrolase)